ncbi:MAG: hypothetical protein JW762_12880 [Dehalococcoidales bacterium]|nr:hypothetical protein [Dehalococcoidales bacterium]
MHHLGFGCEHHTQTERSHHHHGGCGCAKHSQPHQTHGCGCHHHGYLTRRFPTREEMISEMEEYLKQLQAEAKGVEERLAEMKKEDE